MIRALSIRWLNTRNLAANTRKPAFRAFHQSLLTRLINPLLPFDVLEEVEDDTTEEKQEIKKEKKKLAEEKKKLQNENGKDLKNGNDKKDLKNGKNENKDLKNEQKEGSDNSKENLKKDRKAENERRPEESNDPLLTEITTEVQGINLRSTAQVPEDTVQTAIGGGGGNGQNNGGGNNGGDDGDNGDKPEHEKHKEEESEEEQSKWKDVRDKLGRFLFKCLETIGLTLSSVGILGLAGYMYHQFYNRQVLKKIGEAFENGDPAYLLAVHKKTNKMTEADEETEDEQNGDLSRFWVQRPQQELLDNIVNGKIRGRYFLVVGEKGTGKTTLIMEAMKKVGGEGVAIFDAHADPEIFRIRLGRALNFAYSEDYIGSLFSIRGPRDTTALLDIERAFNKLETLAVERKMLGIKDKPLVCIINHSHLIKENEEGVKLLELLQQKAESLSGNELVTMIFNSDDYWVYEKLKRLGTRLELIHVRDFTRTETVSVLQFMRNKFWPTSKYPESRLDEATCNQIYDLIGGRAQHINQVARHRNVIEACQKIIDREKTWFLNQCGLLGEEMDDDVMEFGKFATSAMLLMREFVEMDRRSKNGGINGGGDHVLPELPLWRSRQIMTRPDYIQRYDSLNIFTVDSDSRVRADSVPMMRAFNEIASQPHFDELLQRTVKRVDDIESLGRTREIVMKDLVRGSRYELRNRGDRTEVVISEDEESEEVGEAEMMMEEVGKEEQRERWWRERIRLTRG